MLSQIITRQDQFVQQNFQNDVQTIIASTILQIDQLSDTVVSQLASQFQYKIKKDDKKGRRHQPSKLQKRLRQQIQSTVCAIKQVSLSFTLLEEVYLQPKMLMPQQLKENPQNAQKQLQTQPQALLPTTQVIVPFSKDPKGKTTKNKKPTILQEIKEDNARFKKVLMLLQSQLGMILFILAHENNKHFKEKYWEKYSEMKQFAISLKDINQLYQKKGKSKKYNQDDEEEGDFQSSTSILNFKTIIQTQQTIRGVLKHYNQQINCLKQLIQERVRAKYLMRGLNRLRVINAKLSTISQIFPYSCIVDKNDLFSFDIEERRWRKLIAQCVTFRSYADKDTLIEAFNNFKKNLNLVNASMNIIDKGRKLPLLQLSSWYQILRSSKYLFKCFLFKDVAQKQAQYMISSANAELMKQVWNLPEHRVFRDIVELIMPTIEHSQRLFLPRILQEYFNSNGKLPFPETKIKYLSQYGNQLYRKQPYTQSIRIRINSPVRLIPKFRLIDERIKTAYQGAGIITPKIQRSITKVKNIWDKVTGSNTVPEKLIFHIHGGGFISMSSFIHQIYIRKWANDLDVPIVSVDYGKAPDHPYPESLYDCLEAYIWTLYCFQQVYQVKPKNIIFVGDSAGGNLVASLTNLLIAWKLPVPNGLVMCYPVLSVTSKKYTRSLLGTLEDMILPHTMLKLCQSAYAPKKEVENDPLISPLQTPAEYLRKYPQTRIFVGSKDPFHDDCCRFTQRMNSINPGKCYLTIFQEFPHGFLQFDVKTNPHQFAKKANAQICQTIRKMFK